jgi:RHS repeat-associated protein
MNTASLARDSTTNPISGRVPMVENSQYLGIEWDADNRLLAINQGTLRSEFSYDGDSRRVRIVEKSGQTVTSDRRFLWCATEICEERNAGGGTAVKRYFAGGVQQTGQSFFQSRDHLGSIRELSDGVGAIKARYDYDLYGKRSVVTQDQVADFGFTGHYTHGETGLTLAPYRAFDSDSGRWVSEDPLGMSGGVNLYTYGLQNPVNYYDPTGGFAIAAPLIPYGLSAAGALLAAAGIGWQLGQHYEPPVDIFPPTPPPMPPPRPPRNRPPVEPKGPPTLPPVPRPPTTIDPVPPIVPPPPDDCGDDDRCDEQLEKDLKECARVYTTIENWARCRDWANNNWIRCVSGLPRIPSPFVE